MILDLVAALLAALAVGVAPGVFWARLLVPTRDFYTRLAFSTGLSFALVPAFAVLLAKVFDSGVTLSIAVASPSLVFVAGLAASMIFGRPRMEKYAPTSEPPAPMSGYALAALAPAILPGLLAYFGAVRAETALLPIALLVGFAGAAQAVAGRRGDPLEETQPLDGAKRSVAPGSNGRREMFSAGGRFGVIRRVLLPVILALVLCRYYLGAVLHDWPFLRGGDIYSHAVMANRMMEEGGIFPYLVYPPGFHTVVAILARLTNLDPLEVFPLLIPALMALPTLALYALASKLWGRGYGIAAAATSGLVLGSTYGYFDDSMYPNMTSAQFLLPMAVASLLFLYANPTLRSTLLVALLGSSVVLYHPVGSLYTAALLGVIGMFFIPYLLFKRRGEGFALAGSFALLGVLAVAYAWETYDLPGVAGGILDGSGTGSGGDAVASAIGTQAPLPLEHFLATVTAPVMWLGLLGAILLLFVKGDGMLGSLSRTTLLLWALLMFVGSRTSLSGFPERFERDLGVPLALLAAFALGSILKSSKSSRGAGFSLAVASIAASLVLLGAQVFQNFDDAAEAPSNFLMTPEIAYAGQWLRKNNEGGNIIVGPHQNQVPSRAMLAVGDYSALQSFMPSRIVYDRDLPPHGPEPMWDVLWAVNNPGGERTGNILEKYDVRYVVFYKRFDLETTWGSEVPVEWWREYKESPELYENAFENESVIIFEPREGTQTSWGEGISPPASASMYSSYMRPETSRF